MFTKPFDPVLKFVTVERRGGRYILVGRRMWLAACHSHPKHISDVTLDLLEIPISRFPGNKLLNPSGILHHQLRLF